jgi:uncharacterized membrane protein
MKVAKGRSTIDKELLKQIEFHKNRMENRFKPSRIEIIKEYMELILNFFWIIFVFLAGITFVFATMILLYKAAFIW